MKMEFKFRAIDEQASTYLPPPSSSSSSISYFTEQALRGPDFGRPAEFFRNPNDVREAIQRELEKQRIREEIVAGEIARKRLLEAEVRREMLMEREMALRGAERFSTFSGSAAVSAMQFEPRLSLLHQSDGRSLEERLALSLEDRLGYQARRGNGGFGTFSFQHNAEPKISEVKTPSEVSKEKIIFLVLMYVIFFGTDSVHFLFNSLSANSEIALEMVDPRLCSMDTFREESCLFWISTLLGHFEKRV
ncbi:hypothetical protein TEA_013075 [Camellia sinensis var. sinensis]|uniref:Uncharacterized protein n=1 Tax=Camellia sinensis var. sinensis TaxID=542762 RepID=A0A4S4D4P8_CAMSN|nr:hypothetical protein TEA_013075 [Camellia sinensis var. sinensis]